VNKRRREEVNKRTREQEKRKEFFEKHRIKKSLSDSPAGLTKYNDETPPEVIIIIIVLALPRHNHHDTTTFNNEIKNTLRRQPTTFTFNNNSQQSTVNLPHQSISNTLLFHIISASTFKNQLVNVGDDGCESTPSEGLVIGTQQQQI